MIKKSVIFLSCLLHAALFVLVFTCVDEQLLPKKFLVLGIHSKKLSQAYYNPLKEPVPFIRPKIIQPTKKQIVQQKKNVLPPRLKKITEQKKQTLPKKITIAGKAKPAEKMTSKQKNIMQSAKKNVQPRTKKLAPDREVVSQNDSKMDNEPLALTFGGEVDPEIFAYQKAVQEAIEKEWCPPPGVSKGTECVVSFALNNKGEVELFEIVERSTMLLYDLSITRVAKKFTFDACLWGKRFTITFRQ